MNAYELADAITNCTTDPLHNDVANMLRQQADRIAELEKELEEYEKLEQNYMKAIQQLQSRIKEKQSEPVAWRKVVGNVTKHYQYNEMGEGAPLYTTPQTKLSDEEIDEICKQLWERPWLEIHRKFARAIEAKVRGEK